MNAINQAEPSAPQTMTNTDWKKAAQIASDRTPPLWPLKHFVAVNPFLGMSDLSFSTAAQCMARAVPGGMLIDRDFFRKKRAMGVITDQLLEQAIERLHRLGELPLMEGEALPTLAELKTWLADETKAMENIGTFAHAIDRLHGTHWAEEVVEEISRWIGSYLDEGQALWGQPWKQAPLFKAWKEAASLDRNPELLGLKGFRKFVAALPDDPIEAIAQLAEMAETKVENADDWFHREILSVGGWASCLQYRLREGMIEDGPTSLLAVRLAFDVALLLQHDDPNLRALWRDQVLVRDAQSDRELLLQLVWQESFELSHQEQLLKELPSTKASAEQRSSERPDAQMVFCIDVRSEPMRRAIEAENPQVQTFGYAGFFGMPIAKLDFGKSTPAVHCPVILKPPYHVRDGVSPEQTEETLKEAKQKSGLATVWKSFKDSAVSTFSFVEAAGLNYSWSLIRDGFVRKEVSHETPYRPQPDDFTAGCGIPSGDQAELAKGLVRALNLNQSAGRLIVLCGHGASTKNNPYDSGLQCGACGGHSGDFNARLAVNILNRPEVRAELEKAGLGIPKDSLFVAGRHDTTLDEITLFDEEQVAPSHMPDLLKLKDGLKAAGESARATRAPKLGIDSQDPATRNKAIKHRSDDWSQVRPEWGLAGNAAFIVGPRENTKALDLDGRAFLHHYDSSADLEGAGLQGILAGPMVVGSWINLQYYASTANHEVFGSGNKVLHNVNGTHGVQLGNGGDLKSGLPWQSIHDGENWIHEPVRLKVFVDAPETKVRAALAAQPSAAELVKNHWVHLHVANGQGGWQALELHQ